MRSVNSILKDLKSKCRTASQMKMFNKLISVFNVHKDLHNDLEIEPANESDDNLQEAISEAIAKILKCKINKLNVVVSEDGIYLDKDGYAAYLKDKPKSIGKTIDLGTKLIDGDKIHLGEGELIVSKNGLKLFNWHDSGGFAVVYFAN